MTPTKAILTGHTRGLGASLTRQLLQRGISVLGISRNRMADALKKDQPASGTFEEIALDLSDAPAVLAWLDTAALKQFINGAQTILLINNAGMLQPVGPLETQDPNAIARAVSLNVTTPLMLAAAVAADTSALERRIVHISSGAGRNATPGWSIYCATKAALDHHVRAVAMDTNRALRICSLAPGVVDTDMQGEIRGSTLDTFPQRGRFEALKNNGQLASPDDAAQKIVAYLLSDAFGTAAIADVRELP